MTSSAADLQPTEKRRRQKRDQQLDYVLKKITKVGIDRLSDVDMDFLDRVSHELSTEIAMRKVSYAS